MSKPRTLTLKTRQGSRRLAILFAALILLFGFAARMVETHNGAVKIEDVTIDAHGAQLSCRLYYPAYTDHNDKLPAVLTVHGYVCNGGVTKGIAEEIAKRGFVVLNVSGYGTGMSEMPEIDASGHGRYAQMGFGTDTGMYDALNFVRSLQFVDTTRIGMVGHSMGSARTDSTALLDCTFLTVNDQKLNILHNTFGVEIAEGELYADADAIAQAKLNPDQLTYYQHLCEEYTEDFNSTLKAICLLGTGARTSLNQKEVEVAGHTVKRALKTNMIYVSGEFDSIWNFGVVDANKANLNTAEDIQDGFWYALDEQNGTSAILGRMTEVGVADSPELKAAFEARMIRGYEKVPGITHSKEYFDNETNTLIVNYFTQALDYNHGSLTEGTAQPYDPVHNTWWIRVAFNCLGMLSMFALLISLAGWLLKSEVFADLVVQPKDGPQYKDPVNKKRYWLIALVSAVGCGWAIYFSVKNWSKAKVNEILRFVPITGSTIFYLLGASIVAILVLVFLVYTTRKKAWRYRPGSAQLQDACQEDRQDLPAGLPPGRHGLYVFAGAQLFLRSGLPALGGCVYLHAGGILGILHPLCADVPAHVSDYWRQRQLCYPQGSTSVEGDPDLCGFQFAGRLGGLPDQLSALFRGRVYGNPVVQLHCALWFPDDRTADGIYHPQTVSDDQQHLGGGSAEHLPGLLDDGQQRRHQYDWYFHRSDLAEHFLPLSVCLPKGVASPRGNSLCASNRPLTKSR